MQALSGTDVTQVLPEEHRPLHFPASKPRMPGMERLVREGAFDRVQNRAEVHRLQKSAGPFARAVRASRRQERPSFSI